VCLTTCKTLSNFTDNCLENTATCTDEKILPNNHPSACDMISKVQYKLFLNDHRKLGNIRSNSTGLSYYITLSASKERLLRNRYTSLYVFTPLSWIFWWLKIN